MLERALILTLAAGAAIGLAWPEPRAALTIVPEEPAVTPKASASMAGKGFATFVDRAPDGHFYVEAQVNNQPVRFMIDTGASGIALTGNDARRIGLNFDPSEFEIVGNGASGAVTGKRVTLDSVQIEGKIAKGLPAAILGDGLGVSLLGQSFLSRYASVVISDNKMELR